jgi:ornithine cyclodeaminase
MAIFVGRAEVERLLPMDACIAAVRDGLRTLSDGRALTPLRQIMELPERGAMLGLMPGWLDDPRCFGVKVTSVYPDNHRAGLPSHQGMILVFEAEGGALVGGVDGGTVTAIRTAAASAVATDALARADAGTLAILGLGTQAQTHLAAMRLVRPVERVRLWARDPAKAERFAEAHAAPGLRFEVAASPAECVAGADIVCTVSAAAEPILFADDVGPGMHLNVVGSSRAAEVEIDPALLLRARVYADFRPGMIAQGGEFLRARAAGLIDDDHILGEIGELLLGRIEGRRDAAEITLFKSLGHVVEDLVSARHVLDAAASAGLGARVAL